MRLTRTLVLGLAALPLLCRAEVVGTWNIVATPDSAAFVTTPESGWLNVVDAPVSFNDALTGFSVLDDGWANLDPGAIFELTFGAGVLKNNAGFDLVVLDAHYDSGSYALSTNLDGFTAELALGSALFSYTGVDRDYYFENNDILNPSEIWGVGVDLSDLGIGAGVEVSAVRLRATNSSTDPIAVGVLGPLQQPVPEPGTLALLGAGVVSLLRRRRRA